MVSLDEQFSEFFNPIVILEHYYYVLLEYLIFICRPELGNLELQSNLKNCQSCFFPSISSVAIIG